MTNWFTASQENLEMMELLNLQVMPIEAVWEFFKWIFWFDEFVLEERSCALKRWSRVACSVSAVVVNHVVGLHPLQLGYTIRWYWLVLLCIPPRSCWRIAAGSWGGSFKDTWVNAIIWVGWHKGSLRVVDWHFATLSNPAGGFEGTRIDTHTLWVWVSLAFILMILEHPDHHIIHIHSAHRAPSSLVVSLEPNLWAAMEFTESILEAKCFFVGHEVEGVGVLNHHQQQCVFLGSLLKCEEFLTAKLHYKEGSWVGLGLMRSCNNEQYLSFIAMLTLSQRLLSDASYIYQTQYEQRVLALYLNLSLINQDKISFLLCFRGRSCEHIIWKPPSPSSRKTNWQIC